jgi:transposase
MVKVRDNKLSKEKLAALRQYHALHRRPDKVTDQAFVSGDIFFDARDLVQLKYEMLRRVNQEKQSVTQAAAAFGFSRPAFYQARANFEKKGLAGLLPESPGPRRAHKLKDEVMDFIEQALAQDASMPAGTLAEVVRERFGLPVHPRSIERALVRHKKNARKGHSKERNAQER